MALWEFLIPEPTDNALRATLKGAVDTLLNSGLDSKAVIGLVPVKPLADLEVPVRTQFETQLPIIWQKIKP